MKHPPGLFTVLIGDIFAAVTLASGDLYDRGIRQRWSGRWQAPGMCEKTWVKKAGSQGGLVLSTIKGTLVTETVSGPGWGFTCVMSADVICMAVVIVQAGRRPAWRCT